MENPVDNKQSVENIYDNYTLWNKKQNMCSYILTNKQLDLDEKIKSHIDIY